jgi:uncharacterized protein
MVEHVVLDLPALAGAFGERLRAAGVPVTPQRSADFAHALRLVNPLSVRRLYATARAVFVTDPAHGRAFDAVFTEVFGRFHVPERFEPDEELPTAEPAPGHDRAAADDAAAGAGASLRAAAPSAADSSDVEKTVEVPVAMASDAERLASKSFDGLTAEELAALYRLMSRLRLQTPPRRTRRRERAHHGGAQIDLRRTLRGSLRTAGDPVSLKRRRRRVVPRRLVMLCDISGSMEPYARAYLQFLTCATSAGDDAEAFAFATRLTRLTRALHSRHPERAIQRAAAAAPDWSSGTRIGDALKAFNDRHGRRGMARGAVVVILSDGWERGDPGLVGREMARLSRLAHRIVWVNPRASASAFSVGAGGMVAALPYVDALVSGHSFEALGEVVDAIAGHGELPEAPEPIEAGEVEPWASATPVAGSSVAMPSGHAPKRGHTTAGWVTDE